jgi:hypothetical protein
VGAPHLTCATTSHIRSHSTDNSFLPSPPTLTINVCTASHYWHEISLNFFALYGRCSLHNLRAIQQLKLEYRDVGASA